MSTLFRFATSCWFVALAFGCRVASAAFSNRGLAIWTFLVCGLLIVGPWLRSSISRDFRGIHIPWCDASNAWFLPEYVVTVPRAWQWNSIATPLLIVVAAGIVVALLRPKWVPAVFGLLLATSIPAVAVTLWNHPGLIEFFEGELRDRTMLRTVFRQQHPDLLAGAAPDRLVVLGDIGSKAELLSETHPLLVPFRYWMYGPSVVIVALAAVVVSYRNTWHRRTAWALCWTAAGLSLAVAATWPRWVAEYHWARADDFENTNRFDKASRSLELARVAMPRLAYTRRYWLAEGRLGYRQNRPSEFVGFFLAHQYLQSGEWDRARPVLERYTRSTGGTTAQRELLAEIIAHEAAKYVSAGKHSAAERAWGEAADVAPWRPSYWIGQAVTILAAAPERAKEVERDILQRLDQVGDCFVSSDFVALLGDAYFENGDFLRARDMYAAAMDLFHLPKYVNLHAQEGRLGM